MLASSVLLIYSSKIVNEKYLQAAVWLQYAECLNSLGELDEAARAFQQVLEQVPTHNTARLALSAIQHQLGNPDEAISVLQSGATVLLSALCKRSMLLTKKNVYS